MQLNAISSVALILGLGYGSAAAAEEVRNIAIIGAGAAGSSTAYHLHRYASQEGLPVNVTIFEKTSHVGGRTLTVNAWGSPNEPIELGASIFVEMNEILYNATKAFKLPLGGKPHAAEEESSTLGQDTTAIWDGENIVYQSDRDGSWWWDAAKLWWKYGMAPYKAVKLVKEVVGQFLQLYEEPWFPFRSLTQRAFELGLEKVTAVTGEQFLDQKGINPEFSREIIQAATRVNYASNLAYIHGLEAMVSFATDGAVSIFGGNWQIFDNMVKASNSMLLRQTKVSSITLADKDGPDSPPKYRLKTKNVKTEDSSDEEYPIVFDNVVIASPWQFSEIDADTDVIQHKIDEIPYMKLHVTLFTSPYRLRPGFFGLDPGTQAPSTVYTTLGKDETPQQGADGVGRSGFYSISKLRTAVNPETRRLEFVYKIFSPKEVTPEFLTDILGATVPFTFTGATGGEGTDGVSPISWYYPHWFYSYPIELPRVTFQDPILGDGLYYTSGIESFISTMETSALMGMNVARLIADDAAGVKRGGAILEEEEEDDDDAALRGKVIGDEL